jgi:hypothetical protein
MSTTLQSASLAIYFKLYLPIFFGFAITGYALFWDHLWFETIGVSGRTLWAISCGDNVFQTFSDVWDESMMKTLFLIVYMVCFFTAMMNIFFAIIQEGYDRSRLSREKKKDEEKGTTHID